MLWSVNFQGKREYHPLHGKVTVPIPGLDMMVKGKILTPPGS
jgi:hypothetical protein